MSVERPRREFVVLFVLTPLLLAALLLGISGMFMLSYELVH
jgi:hypothetical protein